uniref:SSD domain-containing protein n=1 Tax=Angiostrongylus cantonensis TaxID=6313 RepID=A0A0K0DM79_ANGCA
MRPLERFFYVYGDFITRHPWPFIIVPTLLTLISSYGMLSFHSHDDIWDIYAPLNALSRVEEKGLLPFEYASASHHYRMQILVTRKDHTNVLTNEVLDELYDIQKFITENMTASNGIQDFNYSAICGIYCQENNGVIIAFLRKRVFLGYSLGDLTFYDDQPDEIKEARLLILHFMVDTSLPNGKRLAADFESKLRRVFAALSESSADLLFSLLSREREIEEQRKITITSIPYLGITVLVLIIFMFLTLIDFPLYRSQFMESLVGIFSPAMALWTSCGILFWIGFPFTNILTVVPFLVVTIGIDDAFLLLAGWRQST